MTTGFRRHAHFHALRRFEHAPRAIQVLRTQTLKFFPNPLMAGMGRNLTFTIRHNLHLSSCAAIRQDDLLKMDRHSLVAQ